MGEVHLSRCSIVLSSVLLSIRSIYQRSADVDSSLFTNRIIESDWVFSIHWNLDNVLRLVLQFSYRARVCPPRCRAPITTQPIYNHRVEPRIQELWFSLEILNQILRALLRIIVQAWHWLLSSRFYPLWSLLPWSSSFQYHASLHFHQQHRTAHPSLPTKYLSFQEGTRWRLQRKYSLYQRSMRRFVSCSQASQYARTYHPSLPAYIDNSNWCNLGNNIVHKPNHHSTSCHAIITNTSGKYLLLRSGSSLAQNRLIKLTYSNKYPLKRTPRQWIGNNKQINHSHLFKVLVPKSWKIKMDRPLLSRL